MASPIKRQLLQKRRCTRVTTRRYRMRDVSALRNEGKARNQGHTSVQKFCASHVVQKKLAKKLVG